ncbi:hypothetical protein GCM10009665_74890 [Kitasatospora nipponensis]|uniref:Uncharacterized protein n=1 Tax=Kitasatospora nipponensis TaxID=258049 RepID=A0ABN1T8I6_9ACTN
MLSAAAAAIAAAVTPMARAIRRVAFIGLLLEAFGDWGRPGMAHQLLSMARELHPQLGRSDRRYRLTADDANRPRAPIDSRKAPCGPVVRSS